MGVDLQIFVFIYDQIYIALSQVTSAQGVIVLLSENGNEKINNVVSFQWEFHH